MLLLLLANIVSGTSLVTMTSSVAVGGCGLQIGPRKSHPRVKFVRKGRRSEGVTG